MLKYSRRYAQTDWEYRVQNVMPHTKVIWTWTKESLFFIETIQLDMTTPTNNSRVKKLHLKKRLMPLSSMLNLLCYAMEIQH